MSRQSPHKIILATILFSNNEDDREPVGLKDGEGRIHPGLDHAKPENATIQGVLFPSTLIAELEGVSRSRNPQRKTNAG